MIPKYFPMFIKSFLVVIACITFFIGTNDVLLRYLIMMNIAVMAFITIKNPFVDNYSYNNIYLTLSLIGLSLCVPYIHFHGNRHLPSNIFYVIKTIVLSYLYQTHPIFKQTRYAHQLAVYIPLLFHFTHGSYVEARAITVQLVLLLVSKYYY